MHRKPLFETIWNEMLDSNALMAITVFVGAVSFYMFLTRNDHQDRRRESPPPTPKKHGASFLRRIHLGEFSGRTICISWETLVEKHEWRDCAKETLLALSSNMIVYLMCHISNANEKGKVLSMVKDIPQLARHNILFCETEKGYEAFSRQIKPAILVTHDSAQAEFLSLVLPNVVLVGSSATGSAMTSISSLSELLF
ncbi:uncharacterized protein TEOVI_000419100 [Trypanosoma equiperdum]|uniref:Uncharacterized protein n=2 Tax=Trypanozoon TaxID=39700 RepID=Q38AL6_TRYB2|nr:hypothetical protein, conserved [Trypanosoma brucei brucei TREU927]EAN78154.1 hypothetical protein, conserved [Trypanosoma brucei brucei TREU927]SCU72614.1 hypothetical protein, conserved [Trypanosoma equiperdum]